MKRKLGCLAAACAFGVVSDAGAASLWSSNCIDSDVKMTYNAGDQVCASGDVDVQPPMTIGGAGDLYVIPKDHPNPFVDVTPGGANYFVTLLGAGAFLDQSVWLPPLMPGEWELVLDQYPFWDGDGAAFDSNVDIRGAYFTVSNAPIVFSCDPAAIKAAAAQSAAEAALIHKTVALINAIKLLKSLISAKTPAGVAYILFCKALSSSGVGVKCPPKTPWGWTEGKALSYLSALGKNLERMYSDIAADPPDASYHVVVPIDMSEPLLSEGPWPSPRDDAFSNRMSVAAQHIAIEASAYQAFLPSFEKLQGAQIDGDHRGLLMQSEKMIDYLDLAEASAELAIAEADALEAVVSGSAELAETDDGAEWQTLIETAVQDGMSETDQNFLRSFGLSETEVAEASAMLGEFADGLTLDAEVGYPSVFAKLRSQHDLMSAAVDDLRAQAEAVRNENAALAFRVGPDVQAMAMATGSVGTPLTVAASATHFDANATVTFTWDTDLDGVFDDASGAVIDFIPTAPGTQLVVVKATDDAGLSDVAFARVSAMATNVPPNIDSLTPDESAPFADVGEVITWTVTTSDGDGDPLTTTWLVDGVEAGTGESFSFTMPDEEAHVVVALVADDDPYTPDTDAGIVVRASKWEDRVPGMGGEGGSATGGSSSSGGSNGVDQGGDGCGCHVPGRSDDGLGWLALLALAGTHLARRRR